jgi:hypothetical protein
MRALQNALAGTKARRPFPFGFSGEDEGGFIALMALMAGARRFQRRPAKKFKILRQFPGGPFAL